MGDELDDKLAAIGAESEAAESDQAERPIPPYVKVRRPNRGGTASAATE